MSTNTSLPPEAWECISVDGKECQGCFYSRVEKLFDRGNKEKEELICWMVIPRCQCPECRVFCGSIVISEGETFEVTHQGKTADRGCDLWYLKPICDNC